VWLIVTAIFALMATLAWMLVPKDEYRLGGLSLAFWGLALLVFVDHTIGWFLDGREGEFMEISAEAFMLSMCMIIPILAIWELIVIVDRFKARSAPAIADDSVGLVEEETAEVV